MYLLCSYYILLSFGLDNLPEGIRWAKQPYILDGRHLYTRLLVIHYHNKMGHLGGEAVMNQHRQRCWILGIGFSANITKVKLGVTRLNF
jgi:hypothetical protein